MRDSTVSAVDRQGQMLADLSLRLQSLEKVGHLHPLSKGSIPIFATAAARDAAIPAPAIGSMVYVLDTAKLLVYSGATVGWTLPWNEPWGHVAYVEYGGANQATFTALTDITGATVTFTAVANRYYRAWGQLNMASSVTGDVSCLHLNIDANATFARSYGVVNNVSQVSFNVQRTRFTLGAGSRVVKLQGFRNTGTGNITAFNSDGTFIGIEDIGPNGLPS